MTLVFTYKVYQILSIYEKQRLINDHIKFDPIMSHLDLLSKASLQRIIIFLLFLISIDNKQLNFGQQSGESNLIIRIIIEKLFG